MGKGGAFDSPIAENKEKHWQLAQADDFDRAGDEDAASAEQGAGDDCDDYDHLIQLVLVGDKPAGVKNLMSANYYREECQSHLGLCTPANDTGCYSRDLNLEGKTICVRVYRYSDDGSAPPIKTINGIMLIFNTGSTESFDNAKQWMELQEDQISKNVRIVLAGNNLKPESREVDAEAAQGFASSNGIPLYMEMNGNTGEGVCAAFTHLVDYTSTHQLFRAKSLDLKTPDKNCCSLQ